MELVKTGGCFFRDDQGLWLAESFQNENGEATTQSTLVEPAHELTED